MKAPQLYLAWLVATVAMLGSLYFSEIRFFIPCTLCWYQRIMMYPLVLILGIAAYKQDAQVTRYALPLSIIGMGISAFHYLEQKVPWVSSAVICRTGIPCDTSYINWLGFITIPLLAFTAFTIITVLLVIVHRNRKQAR